MKAEPTHAIGLDIGGTKTAVALWGLEGRLVARRAFDTEGPAAELIRRAADTIRDLADESGVSRGSLAGIGISCGGPLDAEAGLVLSPPNLPSWDAVPVARLLSAATGLPAWLENDANACALAEWRWGAGRGCRSMAFLTFGTGLGAGLILDGRLYRGASGLAGEVGHLRVAEDGPLGYGKRGSWEGFCSGGGLARLCEERLGLRRTAKEICDEARSGDAAALRIVEESAAYLGRGIAMLMDTLNPERIVVGSVFARSEALFRPAMEAAIAAEALPGTRERCLVLPAGLGDLLGDWAALGVVMDRRNRQ
jgi:glucokinase